MLDRRVLTWLSDVKEAVAELIRDGGVLRRFREQVQLWSADVEKQKGNNQEKHIPALRMPLPIGQQTLSLVEEYAAVAAIHDWLTEEPENRIDPWNGRSGAECHESNNYFVLRWNLDQHKLHKNERLRVWPLF